MKTDQQFVWETADLFGSDVSTWGETVAVERVDECEVAVWINNHRATFTASEAEILGAVLRSICNPSK